MIRQASYTHGQYSYKKWQSDVEFENVFCGKPRAQNYTK